MSELVNKKPLVLLILDGFGEGLNNSTNAIYMAKTPNLNSIFSNNSTTTINASGLDVGLPDGQMGNSEVGHTNIGAGRIVYQDLARINKAIDDGNFFENEVLIKAINNCNKNNSSLHLMGLLSDGGVHSHLNHLFALIEMAKNNGLNKIYVHAFTDGRDVSPSSGLSFVKLCEEKLNYMGVGKIATVSGRYYAMDRDNRWDRVKKAFDAIVNGEGLHAKKAVEAVENSYKLKVSDEFIEPTVCSNYEGVCENDSLIFFNFRPDRARQLTQSIIFEKFDNFERKKGFLKTFFVCLTQFDKNFLNCEVAFKPVELKNTFGEFISKQGLKQLRIAETEKYAHVTFFFNGGQEQLFENEERILIKSPNVATYDLQPQMSAFEVTKTVVEQLESEKFDVVVLNYANCDMVGHTGNFAAAVKAVEVVDECVARVVETVKKLGGVAVITADHGNAEKMIDDKNEPFTAHTTNKVKFCVVGVDCKLRENGKLCDISPTLISILGLTKPVEMTGTSLIID